MYFTGSGQNTQKPRSYSEDLDNQMVQGDSRSQKGGLKKQQKIYQPNETYLSKIDSVMTNTESPQVDPSQMQDQP